MTTLLDEILRGPVFPVSGPFDTESQLEGIEQESVGAISATDYIKWAQRSLNRLYGTDIPTDGQISSAYRAAVRRFNREYLGRDYDDIDERTQNQLVLVNESSRDYVEWVVFALNRIGLGPLPRTETLTSAVKNAIKQFQHSVGLKVDGFVGSKTELALIKASGMEPPSQTRGRKVVPYRGGKALLPRGCSSVPGEFLDAVRSFLQERVPKKPIPGEEPQILLKLLCSSKSFRRHVRVLNELYVNLSGAKLDRNCTAEWQKKCGVNRDGVLTSGPLRGRTVLWITGSAFGSEFLSTRALDNLFGDRHLLFIDDPPWDSKPAQRRGWFIQNIAHETFHAHRHMTNRSRAPKTLPEEAVASIDEEIEARRFDENVVREIQDDSAGRRLLAGYVHPDKAFFSRTGHHLKDRFVVERDPFPGILNLTYLEHFAMSGLLRAAAESEGLTRRNIESINDAVEKMRSVELKPIWEGQDAVKNKDSFKDLRLLAVQMDREWTQLGLSDPWTGSHERVAQAHACVFRKIVRYTPHPDLTIRRSNCS